MEAFLERISPCHRIAGDAATEPGWVEALRSIYDHELVLFEGSDYELEFERGERVACPAGSFAIVPPGRRHISRELSGRPGHRYWIHFDWSYAGDPSGTPYMTYAPAKPDETLMRPAPSFVPPGVLRGLVPDMPLALELFQRIESLFTFGNRKEMAVSRALVLELLLELLASGSEERAAAKDSSLRLASKIRQQLERRASGALREEEEASIQRFLAKTGLSYAHQCRVFKKCYGISPLRYLSELRMARVKNLLRDSSYTIKEIGQMLGFDNPCYFSRAFKKSAGMSPRAYRSRRERL